ncbi:MAG: DUF359 domain-containing protein [Candidatus Aenigmarchaeota archaeon]|nr:DUF359 domain-containing protein [Candidatus Aenigmarchaeota archaeon]
MIIAITGTPGTGKTEVAKALSRRLGWMWVSLNELAAEEDLYKGYDKKRKCKIIDIDKLKEEVKILGVSHKNLIIESHYAHEMPADIVIILRTHPKVLRKRMEKKGFPEAKISENMEAEIMEIIKDEAYLYNRNVFEVDTTNKTPDQAAQEIKKILDRQTTFIIKDLTIPEFMIPEFRKPFGEIFTRPSYDESAKKLLEKIDKKRPIIVVGDLASYYLTKNGLNPNMIIVDGKVERKKFDKKIDFDGDVLKVRNPPRHITIELWKAVEESLNKIPEKRIKIVVEGEEDLAVLPCAIHAPEGSYIVYGQFREGIVLVELNKKKKEHAKALLDNIIYAQ